MRKQTLAASMRAGLGNTGRTVALGLATFFMVGSHASAGAVRTGFDSSTLAANDDGSTGIVPIGFAINFFGVTSTDLFVNNNGNVTFLNPLGTYTPFDLTSTHTEIIAPFFADVDTRGAGSGLTSYGNGTVNGHQAFGVTWPAVGYYPAQTNKLNTFQLIIIDRSDTGAGNVDLEFNYNQIQWETGSASGGSNGLGGNSARAGYSNGTGDPGTSFELPGSAVNGAFIDGGPNALVSGSLNSGVAGRYDFFDRNGAINPGNPVPEPGTIIGAAFAGLVLVGGALRRRIA